MCIYTKNHIDVVVINKYFETGLNSNTKEKSHQNFGGTHTKNKIMAYFCLFTPSIILLMSSILIVS